MKTFKMIISYDGTGYSGWQIQPNGVSIQEVIQTFLSLALSSKIQIVGAGRTDAGVHAKGQTAHFSSDIPFDIDELKSNINLLLPKDIRISYLEEVDNSFHSRFCAKKKTYIYKICTNRVQSPFDRDYVYHYRHRLNLDLIRAAMNKLVGKKDFHSFANEGHSGAAKKNSVRTIFNIDVKLSPSGFELVYIGDGFLYKMVRNITGTLLDVGRGRTSLEELSSILHGLDRSLAGPSAPPHGLILEKIDY